MGTPIISTCVVCHHRAEFCPACGRTTSKLVPIDDSPEKLIAIIQNISGHIPKDDRERACVDLIKRFRFLIQKVATGLYRSYSLGKRYNYDYADFYQDVVLEFCELVINDFKIKANPRVYDNSGYAPFGSYIKVKLYRRVQWKMERRIAAQGWTRDQPWGRETLVDYSMFLEGTKDDQPSDLRVLYHEINEAVIANTLNYDDLVLDSISNQKIREIVSELVSISYDVKIVPEREGEIWRTYWLSGLMVDEIRETNARTFGRSKIRHAAQVINTKIIAEYGRRIAIRSSGMNA